MSTARGPQCIRYPGPPARSGGAASPVPLHDGVSSATAGGASRGGPQTRPLHGECSADGHDLSHTGDDGGVPSRVSVPIPGAGGASPSDAFCADGGCRSDSLMMTSVPSTCSVSSSCLNQKKKVLKQVE
eukprot:gb/GECH01009821.1/.p1 GENE.gb/GECH01009821.1/~~gb/GECH01009821.1/.p1  ORF type:complete len:129 (+),score=18.82 gb/GECH01009821.1/:1-387(+)